MLSNKMKPHHNHIILSLQYQKLCRKGNESVQEWMGRVWTKVAMCKYRQPNRLLAQQFVVGIKDDDITDDLLKEVTILERIKETTKWVCVRLGEQSGSAKSTKICAIQYQKRLKSFMPSSITHRSGSWGSMYWQMQVLWHRAPTLAMPCTWKEVWRMWWGQPLQGGI